MRCRCIMLTDTSGARVHIFGFASDLERAEMLYTSLLIQMRHGLAVATVPGYASSPRAWRRSWLLGFCTAVTSRVRAAEQSAAASADAEARRAAVRRQRSCWPAAITSSPSGRMPRTRSPVKAGSPTADLAIGTATPKAGKPISELPGSPSRQD